MEETKKENLIEKVQDVKRISELIKAGDITTAGFAIETLDESYNKNPLYASLAIKLAQNFDTEFKKSDSRTKELAEQLLQYCIDKCEYFKK